VAQWRGRSRLIEYGTSARADEPRSGAFLAASFIGAVEEATKIELTLNLKTAKTFGLTIPETLLATVDEVIQ
jgi:putative ABC transport system substrate-binding protein